MVGSCIGILSSADSTTILFLEALILLVSFPASAASTRVIGGGNGTRATSRSVDDLIRLQSIKDQLARVRNVSVKTIQSPDGDVIDCVPTHLQPAFEHPKLRGLKPEEQGLAQMWTSSGESCPDGTIPVRRTTASDLLRASSARRFGTKKAHNIDSLGFGHEHSVAAVSGSSFYGAMASLNVWSPQVAATQGEFSLAQVWVTAGTYRDHDLNTIETGWQVCPLLYRDTRPRFFVYWTRDAYKTGCYNLLCSGFVQTSNKIAIGGAVSRVSSYGGPQFDITVIVWKDLHQGNWWLQVDGKTVGYWPSALFTHLAPRADTVHFGGEVATALRPRGAPHTLTQMGSGRFAYEGYRRASYVRYARVVVVSDGGLIPAARLRFIANRPGCYSIVKGRGRRTWGTYFYYGGPGRNILCPKNTNGTEYAH